MNYNRQIQECILNIDMTCRSMYLSYQDVKKFKIPLNSVIYGDMLRYSYIQLCSVMDEFIILSGIAKNDNYLRDTLYVISPALKAINKYTGIKKARNIMIAHFNRDKKGNFYPWWIGLMELKLPRTQKEINQIYSWLHLINGIVVTRYYDELKNISLFSKKEVDKYFNWVTEQEETVINVPTPFDEIYQNVENRMKEMKILGITIDPAMVELAAILNGKNNQK